VHERMRGYFESTLIGLVDFDENLVDYELLVELCMLILMDSAQSVD
jgi:hypothetical protein